MYERILDNQTNEITLEYFNKIDAWNKDAALFLLKSLNYFENHTDTVNLFNQYFTANNYNNNKVCLFQKDIDLFDLCINPKKGADFKNTIMFFAFLYMIQTDSVDTNKLRIIRNLAWNSENELRFKNDLFSEVKLICENISNLSSLRKFNTNQINEEIEKSSFLLVNPQLKEYLFQLEDLSIFKGHLTALSYNEQNLVDFNKILLSFFSSNTDSNQNAMLFGRAMLYYGDYSEWISGKKWLFVNSEQSLTSILRDSNKASKDRINKSFTLFVKNLGTKSIEDIINQGIKESPKDDWVYYFMKYPEILKKSKNGLLHWDDNFEIACLTGETLKGWWYDPYIYTVYKKLPKEIQDILGTKFLKNLGYLDDCKPLTINNCEILPCSQGWKITRKSNTENFKKQFDILSQKLKDGILIVPKDSDRIEVCCNLVKEIFNWNN